MKILVDYDQATGNIQLENGSVSYVAIGLTGLTEYKDENSVIEMLKLGATPDDIIKMKHNGVLK